MFIIGNEYRRRDIHAKYGGQRQGGICTPAKFPLIFIFTGKTGNQYGYIDGWQSPDVFYYTGEGQEGDMAFNHGNLAIRDHVINSEDLHLFENLKKGFVKYIGQMICIGYHVQISPDFKGNNRNAIIFELSRFEETLVNGESNFSIEVQPPEMSLNTPLNELKRKALEDSVEGTTSSERLVSYRKRSSAIRLYARKRANGICELCGSSGPFLDKNGELYLEVHHLQRLSDGGPDHPERVAGICPNCHRQVHYAHDAEINNKRLLQLIQTKEKRYGYTNNEK